MLKNIDHQTLNNLSNNELDSLSNEIREYIIQVVSKNGGHLSSNLGVVELTIALHKVFDVSKDKIIFDVSHQSYTHKILTNRYDDFKNLRKLNGLSGFTKYLESPFDAFEAGHSSTAISAGIGYLEAKEVLKDQIGDVICVVGDASIFNGLSFEGLNFLTNHPEYKLIIVLNDNEMGISKNSPSFNMSSFFASLGFEYYGIIDGHDIIELSKYLTMAKSIKKSVIIHVKTQKGKGFLPAEKDQIGLWHAVNGFDLETASLYKDDKISLGNVIANELMEIIQFSNYASKIRVITPAMTLGCGLENLAKKYPDNFIDVGLAEENACVFAAAIAHAKLIPIVFCYSTFLQRAYDELLHDVARTSEHVIFCVDHAGIVSFDGDTHQGIFDLGYLYSIPNVKILAPNDASMATSMIHYAINHLDGPVFIRYSKEKVTNLVCDYQYNPSWLKYGNFNKVIITYGVLFNELKNAISNHQIEASLINAHSIDPLDEKMLESIKNNQIFVYEEVFNHGSLGDRILNYYNQKGYNVSLKKISLDDTYLEVGSREELLEKYHLSLNDLKKVIGD